MALWTAAEIARATGGTASAPFAVTGVAFDSREIMPGDLFVALHGSTTDGHRFIPMAIAKGAAGILCKEPAPHPHVQVADSFAALQALGRAARARTQATVIGVTGSVGKTSVKEALRQTFSRSAPGKTHWSVKSYNNETGVPLSLARMPRDTRFAILEMGMNHAGEIRAHTALVRPHVAVVTWVTSAHIAFFPEESAIARAKAEIFEGVAPGGIGIYPHDNIHAPILREKILACRLTPLSFGFAAGADVRATHVHLGPDGSEVTADVAGETLTYRIGMAGQHWVSNSLAVLAATKAAGGVLAEAGAALAALHDLPGRGSRLTIPWGSGHVTLLDESYNANPASMEAALAVLGRIPGKRHVAILGAMRELGSKTAQFHAGLAEAVDKADIAALALVGEEMQALQVPGAAYLQTADDAGAWAQETMHAGDILLVKGSNSVGLSKLVAALKGAQ